MLKRRDFIGSTATVAAVLTLGCGGDDSGTDAGTGGNGSGGTDTGGSSSGGAASGGSNTSGGASAAGGSNTGGSNSGGTNAAGGSSSGGTASGGGGGGGGVDECGVEIETSHPHTLVVPPEDVAAGVEKQYVMDGAHTHSFLLTAADFAMLAAGNPVTKDSGGGGAGNHTHSTTVTCA